MEVLQLRKRSELFAVFILIVSSILALFCASYLCSRYRDLLNAKGGSHELYERFAILEDNAEVNTSVLAVDSTAALADDKAEAHSVDVPIHINMDALTAEYPAIVGWLHCDGTEISYPVVQASDNSYYLNHLITGEYNFFGSIFLDCASSPDFSDNNSIIYGHNMRMQGMFHSLLEYADQTYYVKHPVMFLITKDATYCLRVFSAYTARSDADAYSVDLYANMYSDYLRLICESSVIQSDITVDKSDRIITLSTCSYDFSDARFLVHCLLERV